MTDEDIIKALECCSKNGCKECKYKGKSPDCITVLQNDAFNLINRLKGESNKYRNKSQAQKDELSRLYEENNRQKAENEKLKGSKLALYIRDITVKEFAERLKYKIANMYFSEDITVSSCIDNLVKEMTESKQKNDFKRSERMKDRLIELIGNYDGDNDGDFADYLLANGVKVLPCNVGDAVYRIVNDAEPHITKDYVSKIANNGTGWWLTLLSDRYCPFSEFGKSIFLAKEEAEKALKERAMQNVE